MSATEKSLAATSPADEPDQYIGDGGEIGVDRFGELKPNFPATTVLAATPRRGASRLGRGSTAAIFVLATALVGGALAWYWAANQGERYSATAVVQLEPASTIEESRDVVDVVGSLDRGTIVVTAAGVANSGVVKGAAQQQLGLTSGQMDDYEVEALQVLTSHLIDITVTGPNEERAADYADAIADELRISFTRSYPVYQISTVTPATAPDSSSRPGAAIVVVAAMVASAIGAFMLWLALFGGSDERTDLPLARRS